MTKVEDYENLVRDPVTGAIINSNSSDLTKAKQIKAKILAKDEVITDMTDRVSRLEQLVQSLIDKE